MRTVSLVLVFLAQLAWVSAQVDSSRVSPPPLTEKGLLPMILLFDFSLGMQLPSGVLAQRFSPNFHLGTKIQWFTGRNWSFGVFGDLQHSEDVREDVLRPLRNSDGLLIDGQGALIQVPLRQRGYVLGARAAKLIPLKKGGYQRKGLELGLGLGYWQHWVSMRILSEQLLQLQGDYMKGYDRRTHGLAVQGFAGYRYLSKNKMVNLFAGIDYTLGFTRSMRPWHYDLRRADNERRLDLLWGFRAGLSLPIYFYSEKTDLGELEFY